MASPRVLVDFVASPLEVPSSFEQVTSRSVEIRRGKAHERATTQPSRLLAELSNLDRNLDPDNVAGSHWPFVTPLRHIRAEVTLGSTIYPLCQAYVEDWGQTWPGKKDAVVPLQATDGFKLLNLAKVAGTRYFNELYTDAVDAAVVGSSAAHYYLDEPAGAAFANQRLNANWDLNVVGTNVTFGSLLRPPTYGRPYSVEFGPNDDAGDGLSRTTAPPFASASVNTFAWMTWLRLDSLPTDGYVVGMRLGTAGNTQLIWHAVGSTSRITYINPNFTHTADLTSVFVADGEWHHYVVRITIDGSADTVQVIFYRDSINLGATTTPADAGTTAPGQLLAPDLFFVGGDGGLGGNHGIDGNMAQLLLINDNVPSSAVLEALGTPVWDYFPEEPAGLQLHSILDAVGWPLEPRDIDDGTVTMGAMAPDAGDPVLSVMLDIAETSERGLLYADGAGVMTFRDAGSLAARVSEATFGDEGTELRYQELETRHDDVDIYNQIAVSYDAQFGGTGGQVYVEDADSIASFGPRLLQLTVRLVQQTDAAALADRLLAAYKDPRTRPVRLTLVATDDVETLEQIFARRPGDRITVVRRPPGGGDPLVLDAVVEGTTTRGLPGGLWTGILDLAPFI